MSSSRGFLSKMSVGRKMALLPALFILGATATLIYTVTNIQSQDSDTFTIDMASRQRILNERYLRQTVLAAGGRAVDRDSISQVVMETANSMQNGGSVISRLGTTDRRDMDAAPNDAIRASIEESRRLYVEMEKAANEYLAAAKGPGAAAAFDKLVRMSDQTEESMKSTVKTYVKYFEHRGSVMMQWEIAIFLVVAAVGIYLSWLISSSIVNPLENVVKMAQGISAGDLRQEKLAIQSEDEIGKLGVVFNEMIDSLRDLASQSVSISKNLGSAAAEVLASVQQQAAATKQQAASVQETTTTMEEISQSGSQIAERARQVAGVAEASSGVSNAGVNAVQGTNSSMVGIREQVESVAENIVTLSERNQAIAEIIATVNDIAEQTNLLALNAAIEAAAAGDQGRSFSVVANEMKNLAEQAKESTVQVRSILSEIQKGINSSVMLTEEAVKRADGGKQQAEVAEQTIRRLSDTTEDSIQAFQQIVGATNQQQIGFEQITQALKNIRLGAEQTAASTNQLEKAAMSMNALGQQLQQSVARYRI